MKKSAPTKKKVIKKSLPAKKIASSSRVKSTPWHQKSYMVEHQERLHNENPALRSLLYVMLAAMVVLIALLFIQGQSLGIW